MLDKKQVIELIKFKLKSWSHEQEKELKNNGKSFYNQFCFGHVCAFEQLLIEIKILEGKDV